jgi:predicted amidohydrolase
MPEQVKIAAAQIDPKIGANPENLTRILKYTRTAAAEGAQLIVFPECALCGYVFSNRMEALPFMETVPGPATEAVARLCQETGTLVVFGLLEKDGRKCYNSAVLIGPQGLVGNYRKVHLPFLGIDRYLDKGGQPFRTYDTPSGKLGLLICYDINFPEAARSMVLQGADILVLPTNWPQGRAKVPEYVIITRAFENKVHLVAADRVGEERGTRFLGTSKILNCWGDILAEAGPTGEEIIYGEVNLNEARQKHVVLSPGEFEYDFIHDRQPDLYGELGRK